MLLTSVILCRARATSWAICACVVVDLRSSRFRVCSAEDCGLLRRKALAAAVFFIAV